MNYLYCIIVVCTSIPVESLPVRGHSALGSQLLRALLPQALHENEPDLRAVEHPEMMLTRKRWISVNFQHVNGVEQPPSKPIQPSSRAFLSRAQPREVPDLRVQVQPGDDPIGTSDVPAQERLGALPRHKKTELGSQNPTLAHAQAKPTMLVETSAARQCKDWHCTPALEIGIFVAVVVVLAAISIIKWRANRGSDVPHIKNGNRKGLYPTGTGQTSNERDSMPSVDDMMIEESPMNLGTDHSSDFTVECTAQGANSRSDREAAAKKKAEEAAAKHAEAEAAKKAEEAAAKEEEEEEAKKKADEAAATKKPGRPCAAASKTRAGKAAVKPKAEDKQLWGVLRFERGSIFNNFPVQGGTGKVIGETHLEVPSGRHRSSVFAIGRPRDI